MSISNKRAADLLVTAFEGGSNYWYMIQGYSQPDAIAHPWGAEEYHPSYISFPFSTGGAVIISDLEDENGAIYKLNKKAIARGKKIMSTNPDYSHYYADVLKENDDAETGDAFLQLCLFGEVIYG